MAKNMSKKAGDSSDGNLYCFVFNA